MTTSTDTTSPSHTASRVPASATQFVALSAGLLGLATAWADGIELQTFFALASVVFAVSAYSGFTRLSERLTTRLAPAPALHAVITLFLPAAFLLFIVVGTDYVQRGVTGWSAFATGLPLGLLAACISLITQIDRRGEDLDDDRQSTVTGLETTQLKLVYLLLCMPAYGWLVVQVGRDSLPQFAGAAAITLVLSFKAARDLNDYASDEPGALDSAIRLTVLAAPLFGLLLAGALVFDAL